MCRRLRTIQIIFLLTGVVIVVVNIYCPIHPTLTNDQPDILPFRLALREVRGKVVWPNRHVGVGLPLSKIRDLGENKIHVLLVVIVSTAPIRRERRDAIRQTWWWHCDKTKVACHFFTDGLVVNKKIQRDLLDESSRNGDMEFQPLIGGIEFGLRFLYHVKWASAKYDFQFFLRTDDDYFVCLEKLLHELPVRPRRNLCWGYFHCDANTSWVDESWMVFSHDIVYRFIEQDARTMLCHPHADQQIALWLNNISERIYFHDERLNHLVNSSFDWWAGKVCEKYMGVHRAFASRMAQVGRDSSDGAKEVPHIANYSAYCKVNTFDYKKLPPPFFYEPRPCVENPSWVKNHRLWIGEEGKS